MATFLGTPGNDRQETGFSVLFGGNGNDRLGSDHLALLPSTAGPVGMFYVLCWSHASAKSPAKMAMI